MPAWFLHIYKWMEIFMQITELVPQKRHKNRLNVYVDGEFSFGIDEFDAFRLKLKAGKEITEDEISEIKETVIFSKCKEYTLSLVSARFYTEEGIKRKLKEKEYDEETIEKTIEFLKEYNLINDFDYAKKYIEECLNLKKYGRNKIKMQLREKGILGDTIDEAMSYFDFDELENSNLAELVEKKLGGDFEYKNIMKTKRYFMSRGYDFGLIDRAIRKITKDEF